MTKPTSIRLSAAGLLACLSLILSGCFITPGKFTSELILQEDETFTFTYEGEIFFLGLSSIAQMGAAAENFAQTECYDEETFEERECTEAEIAEQREEWDASTEMRAAEAKEKAEQLAAMTGGIDPNDPEAAADLTRLLLRHKGWQRVDPKGNGVFDISYSVTGSLTHDFMFPIIEGFPMTNPFVQMHIRDEQVVRINAPGFAAQNDENPMGSMMGGMAGLSGLAGLAAIGSEGDQAADAIPEIPQLEGVFSIVTTGNMKIRANNTDEGASPTPTGEVLTWDISARTKSAPTALIAIGQ
ncbi:hypothetical protein FGU71_00315 [Erythrobacter insulae]|uniref:Uncharacterized protein n=1 Tax=Erythrobacter insulae TaxID=2584124 RepID=A0A547P8K7_9SPHN|nr:hypothetical protein [Erythrobacter insulae]TRD10468.1 hypothetical protein FGU71_00315 [Erythrobacter insulae]